MWSIELYDSDMNIGWDNVLSLLTLAVILNKMNFYFVNFGTCRGKLKWNYQEYGLFYATLFSCKLWNQKWEMNHYHITDTKVLKKNSVTCSFHGSVRELVFAGYD